MLPSVREIRENQLNDRDGVNEFPLVLFLNFVSAGDTRHWGYSHVTDYLSVL
jgi:hypothetical protein